MRCSVTLASGDTVKILDRAHLNRNEHIFSYASAAMVRNMAVHLPHLFPPRLFRMKIQ
jgi:hypothetical protein